MKKIIATAIIAFLLLSLMAATALAKEGTGLEKITVQPTTNYAQVKLHSSFSEDSTIKDTYKITYDASLPNVNFDLTFIFGEYRYYTNEDINITSLEWEIRSVGSNVVIENGTDARNDFPASVKISTDKLGGTGIYEVRGRLNGFEDWQTFRIEVTRTTTETNTKTITVKKTDEDGKPLAGATLHMISINEDGEPRKYEAVTNAEGIATFEVVDGEYTLSEYSAPTGYNKTDKTYKILVSANGVYNITSSDAIVYQQVTFVNYKIPILNKDDHFDYMQGYPNGTFGPNRNMSRAEAVAMFSRLLNETMILGSNYQNNYYPDVKAGVWYSNAIGYMQQLGVLVDYSRTGYFRPNEDVTRAEFATLAAHFDNLTLTSTNKFTDVPADHWAVKYINSAAAKGWIIGYSDNTFKPEANITRAEVVTLVNRILNRVGDETYLTTNATKLPRTYSDVPRGNWAYLDIMEASIGHDFLKTGSKENWTAVYINK